ncbi:S-adenosyl-L-methionine-dependent methyltransferase [Quillaja saponaria]|uniref:S-adenosyl-L-methionine-dependent methyltransferase n=1 Tax=Quillaja saponaria TaxID=32244 RepID=A0AAD7LSG2_QUISA|nr:S-adenosyl-L-methionine-dependent methyltransferase [Quillaja saponaria]
MVCWSAENATKAYLRTLILGKRGKEPDVAEYISALAAGNNAQLMVIACVGVAGSTTLALVAAAHQTGGRVVCISCGLKELEASKRALGHYAHSVEFVRGDPKLLLSKKYKGADFVLVDCDVNDAKRVIVAAHEGAKNNGGLVVGYNALHRGSSWWRELKTHFLPIGEGLLVTKIDPNHVKLINGEVGHRKRSRWIVKIDKCTGEEHVFRIVSLPGK